MKRERFVNGIDVIRLHDTIDQIRDYPEIGKFEFRATNQWVDGTHCRGTVQHFYGAIHEDTDRPPQTVSYTHLRAHETVLDLVCRLLLEKKKKNPEYHPPNKLHH